MYQQKERIRRVEDDIRRSGFLSFVIRKGRERVFDLQCFQSVFYLSTAEMCHVCRFSFLSVRLTRR